MSAGELGGAQWLYWRLHQFFFRPAGPGYLGFCRAIFFGYTLLVYADLDSRGWPDLVDGFWVPVSFFTYLPVLPNSTLAVLDLVFKLAMGLAFLGLLTRPSTIVSFVLGVYLLGLPQSFGKISHRPGLLVITMAILAISRCGDSWSLDAVLRRRRGRPEPTPSGEYTWPIRLVWVVMAVAFMAAGFSKLQGVGWIFDDRLKYVFLAHHFREAPVPIPLGLFLAQLSWLCAFLAFATVVIEAAAPAALISPIARLLLIPSLFMLQAGNSLILGVHIDIPWVAVYAFWVPWDRIGTWLAARRSGVAPAPA